MLKAAWLLPLLFLVLPGLVLGSDDGSLWMEAKPLHGRMVFVRLSAPTPTWEKHYHDRDLIVYVGTKPGDPPVRRADVAISAKDGKGNPVKAEWVEDAQYKGRYSHTYAPGRPDMGDYNFHLRDGRGIASIRVTWRGHRQTFFTAQGLKGLDWKVAEGWLGYVEKPVETYTLSIADDVPLDHLQVHYSTDGGSGGRLVGKQTGDDITFVGSPGQKAIHVGAFDNLLVPITKAKALAVTVFHPGYESATFYEPFLGSSGRKTELHLKPLPTLHLDGRIASYAAVSGDDPIVEISYVACLGCSDMFSGDDSPVPHFDIAEVPLHPDGTFSAEIHDFYKDPLAHPDRPGEGSVLI